MGAAIAPRHFLAIPLMSAVGPPGGRAGGGHSGGHKTGFVPPRERVRAASAGRPETMGTNNDVNEGGETKLGIGGTERGKGEDGTEFWAMP
ncbi:hypothetical protein niasHT_021327 [Heterodera trifolii]|uniref:Uncharacterized protein n=1 Tax=Heterodera trifolii TaxID=157864 RepID=A0ABD2K6Y2_9BILA